MKTLEIVQSLVDIPSETGNEAAIASHIAEMCHKFGWETEDVDGSIVARLRGIDSSKAFILNGHTDTVPVSSIWNTDPFTLTQDTQNHDKLYGLGVSDMKSGLAVMLKIAEEISLTPPPYDIWLFFTKQEETDNAGAKAVTEWFAANHRYVYATVGGIILEPTDARFIGVGHRNGLKLHAIANGIGGHGSKEYPAHLTAIGKLARFVAELELIQAEWQAIYPHELLGSPTINTANISAGNGKHNVVPSFASAEFDLRTTPSLAAVLPEILPRLEEKYDIILTSPWQPTDTLCPPDEHIYTSVQKALPDLPLQAFPGSTDLFTFLEHEIPMLIYGPGTVEAMHIPNEYVKISAIKLAKKTIQHVMRNY